MGIEYGFDFSATREATRLVPFGLDRQVSFVV
jgi:hypothetical protein